MLEVVCVRVLQAQAVPVGKVHEFCLSCYITSGNKNSWFMLSLVKHLMMSLDSIAV